MEQQKDREPRKFVNRQDAEENPCFNRQGAKTPRKPLFMENPDLLTPWRFTQHSRRLDALATQKKLSWCLGALAVHKGLSWRPWRLGGSKKLSWRLGALAV
ncbi:MAG: hypothetical protein K8I04_04435 [Gammaproteobacteria bacterium]|nr:hypothetical protein [Gammaproteobacteria bacterium]